MREKDRGPSKSAATPSGEASDRPGFLAGMGAKRWIRTIRVAHEVTL